MKNYPEIIELNKNSNTKYKIGEENINILKENSQTFEKINNYMSLDFYLPSLKERKQVIKFYGFPTDEDGKCLASYYTTLDEDNIFGIKVGSDIVEAEKILLSYGYLRKEKTFIKGVVQIKLNSFSKNNAVQNKISSIEISLDSKYLGNRLY